MQSTPRNTDRTLSLSSVHLRHFSFPPGDEDSPVTPFNGDSQAQDFLCVCELLLSNHPPTPPSYLNLVANLTVVAFQRQQLIQPSFASEEVVKKRTNGTCHLPCPSKQQLAGHPIKKSWTSASRLGRRNHTYLSGSDIAQRTQCKAWASRGFSFKSDLLFS